MSDIHSKFIYPTEAQGAIPAFNSIDEEAEFWDTHDVTDLSVLTSEDFPVNPNEYEFVLELTPPEFRQLVRLARSRGVSPAALVQTWVKERVHQDAPVDASEPTLTGRI